VGELKKKARQYSQAFDTRETLDNAPGRAIKAAKIRAVLHEEKALQEPGARILDIGCSHGHIVRLLTPDDGFGVGVDLDMHLGKPNGNVTFVRGDAELLPFRSGSFDVVICNHVYEHTDDASRLVAEIDRVLAPEGVCYFAGPNKYEPVEPHYRLPFLSWLPGKLADCYMRLTGKGQRYPEKPRSRPQLRQMLSRFDVVDYTSRIVADPVRYSATDMLTPGSIKQRLAVSMLRIAPFFFPGFVFVLRKSR
jgi:SAM-dependent methyltransferase